MLGIKSCSSIENLKIFKDFKFEDFVRWNRSDLTIRNMFLEAWALTTEVVTYTVCNICKYMDFFPGHIAGLFQLLFGVHVENTK